MRVSVDTTTFDRIADDWEALLSECWTDTIFVTPWWQAIWLRHFGDQSTVRILKADDDAGNLLGIAPMSVSGGAVRFLGGEDLFDYHDFLVVKGAEEAFYPAVFDEIASWEWETVELTSLPEASPTIPLAADIAHRRGWRVEVAEESKAPFKRLPPTWDEFVMGLRKKQRHELRRKARKIRSAGRAVQYRCPPEMLRQCLSDFFRLHRASRSDKAEFMTKPRERFFTEIAEAASDRGRLILSMLEFDGVRVAACIGFDHRDSYLLYNSGYAPEYSHLSVGFVNKAWAIKDAIESGKHIFDFLRGAERYKYDLGAEDRSVYTLQIRR